MKDLTPFEKTIGVHFANKELLVQAFTHRSYINENPKTGLKHNERLEFLGDAVLELVVTAYLFNAYPDKDEGELTAYRAALVNSHTIADAARALSMNEYLLLSRGESKDTGKARHYILANTFEAVVGAIYLDQGYAAAEKFLTENLLPKMEEIVAKKLWRDAKSLIQEKAQEHMSITPTYRVLGESGPDHDKQFSVGVFVGNEMLASAKGKSKQEAEQEAARAALEAKDWLD